MVEANHQSTDRVLALSNFWSNNTGPGRWRFQVNAFGNNYLSDFKEGPSRISWGHTFYINVPAGGESEMVTFTFLCNDDTEGPSIELTVIELVMRHGKD